MNDIWYYENKTDLELLIQDIDLNSNGKKEEEERDKVKPKAKKNNFLVLSSL